jgi:hypothetical protein
MLLQRNSANVLIYEEFHFNTDCLNRLRDETIMINLQRTLNFGYHIENCSDVNSIIFASER